MDALNEAMTDCVRSEIKRLKSRIHEIEETRVNPFEDRCRELMLIDFEAYKAYEIESGRFAACREMEELLIEIEQLEDALHGRPLRGVSIN